MGDLAGGNGASVENDAVIYLDWNDTIKSNDEIVDRENKIGSTLQV